MNSKHKIMLIEDDSDVSDIMQIGLKEVIYDPFEIAVFNNAEDGFASCLNTNYALVITDFNLPGMNGFDFIKNFRSLPSNKSVPVIFISGFFTELETAKNASNFEKVIFLDKPFEIKKLAAHIRIHLFCEKKAS